MKTLSLNAIKTLFAKHKGKIDDRYASIDRQDITKYVSTTGNDETGDGSLDHPFFSIQKAIKSLNDITVSCFIYVDEGTYEINEEICIPSYHRIYIMNTPGKNIPILKTNGSPGIAVNPIAYLYLCNVVIHHTTSNTTDAYRKSAILGNAFSNIQIWGSKIILNDNGYALYICGDASMKDSFFCFVKNPSSAGVQTGVFLTQGGKCIISSTCSVLSPDTYPEYNYPDYGYCSSGGILFEPKNFWHATASEIYTTGAGRVSYIDPTA